MLDPTGNSTGVDAVSQPVAASLAEKYQGASPSPVHGRFAGRLLAEAKATLRDLIALAKPTSVSQWVTLCTLALADLALLAAFVVYAYAEHYGLQGSFFYGNLQFSFVDGGYPEVYGYAKQALAAVLLMAVHALDRQAVYRALALLFAITMLDDSLALHETLGAFLASAAGVSIRLAELAAWAVIGLIPLVVVAASYRHSSPASRADARAVLLAFAVLLFFAVGMDVVHGIASRYMSGLQTVFTIAEDGGELMTLTLICAVVIGIHQRAKAPKPDAAGVKDERPDCP